MVSFVFSSLPSTLEKRDGNRPKDRRQHDQRGECVDVGGDAAFDGRVDQNRERGRAGTGGEEADHEIIDAHRERERRSGEDAGPHQGQRDVPKCLPGVLAKIMSGFFDRAAASISALRSSISSSVQGSRS